MKSKEMLVKKIKEVFHSEFQIPLNDMRPKSHLYKDLGLDSIDAIDLVVRLEVETGLKLKAADLKTIRTFQDVIDVVWSKLNNNHLTLHKK